MRLILGVFLFSLWGCGMNEKSDPPAPEVIVIIDPGDEDPQPDGATSWVAVKEIIDRKCISCHLTADFVRSDAELRASRAFDMVDGNNMPPNNPLKGKDRTAFLNFFF